MTERVREKSARVGGMPCCAERFIVGGGGVVSVRCDAG